jgi:hypothetical protein
MQAPSETSRGIEYLRNIVESGKILKMSEPRYLGQGSSHLIEITGFGKRWTMGLTTDQMNDLPDTKEYRDSALSLARILDSRFKNLDPNLYVTNSGRLLQIDAKWPAMQWMNEARTAWIAASGLWMHLTDFLTGEVARCAVVMTTLQTMPGMGSTPFSRLAVVINSVRSAVDFGTIRFYPSCEAMGDNGEHINFGFRAPETNTTSTQAFLLKKVWLLGFKAGRKDTSVWIPDPWDANYLGSSTSELQQSAAVLEAQEKIVLDENHEFASVGRALLAQEGPKQLATVAATPQFRTALGAYTLGSPLGEGGSGKVFRVVDEDGSEHALKYLRPDGQTSQKSRRFKNELAFCLKNTHPNIITVEDWGLAQVNDVEVPFYVMPVYPQTLRTLMDQGTSPDLLMSIFLQILDGVQAAHVRGIWHRDLKPQNVLYDPITNRAVVTDFGIAHFAEGLLYTTIETRASDRLANFRYAAPEQRANRIVDQRADIYALGLILYEMFTGELLQGTSHKQIGSVHPHFGYLDSLVEKMSRQSPDDRPTSIGDIKEALNQKGI